MDLILKGSPNLREGQDLVTKTELDGYILIQYDLNVMSKRVKFNKFNAWCFEVI
jgi:hypothetical protein